MTIDQSTIARNARLAQINITPDESELFQNSLTQIFGWIQQLDELDTQNVDPLFSVHIHKMPERDDQISDGNCVKAILSNAPEQKFDMFSVPKVID